MVKQLLPCNMSILAFPDCTKVRNLEESGRIWRNLEESGDIIIRLVEVGLRRKIWIKIVGGIML